MIQVLVTRLPHARDLDLPAYATPGSAGLDLRAAVDAPLVLAPGDIVLVPTGVAVAIPEGHEGQVRPRSGLASKHGITLLNAPGTVDADYRGELKCTVVNHGRAPFTINRGDRIAQMVIAPVARAELVEADSLPATVRGGGGFGHTGLS